MVTAMQAAGLTVTAVMAAKLLERHAKEQALMLTLLLGMMLTGTAILALTTVLNRAEELLSGAGLSAEAAGIIGKSLGICVITELAAGICQDAGESALKTAVVLVGKAALLLIALPLIEPLIRLILEMLA